MNQKGFASLKSLIIVIILLGTVSYFAFNQKPSEINPDNQTGTSTPIIDTNVKQTPKDTSTNGVPTKKSGIKGKVIGHYCAGAQMAEPPPGYTPCGEEPLASFSLNIKNDVSGAEKQIITDSNGNFQIELIPGKYTITSTQTNGRITGGPFNIEVKSEKFTETELKFEELRA